MLSDRDIRNRVSVPPRPESYPLARPLAIGVEIGPVRWRELMAVARLQRRAFRPALAYSLTTLLLLRMWPRAQFLVARRMGQVVGCAIGDRHEGQTRVVNLAVDPTVRRRGIGAALLRRLEEALPGGDIILMVEAENMGAQELYRREGYLPVGRSGNYYGRGRAGIWMQKSREAGGGRRKAAGR